MNNPPRAQTHQSTGNVGHWHDPARLCSSSLSEQTILNAGLVPPSRCDIGGKCYIPHGTRQFQGYRRRTQMENGTQITLFLEGRQDTGKRFIIIDIQQGHIQGIQGKFNGYILKLDRIG